MNNRSGLLLAACLLFLMVILSAPHVTAQLPSPLPDLVFIGEGRYAQFGSALASAGDVNGDGFGDFIVGARAFGPTDHGPYYGRAYIYFGGPLLDTTPDVVLSGTVPDDRFGHSVAGVGDINGDGFDDVAVSALYPSVATGTVFIFYGGAVMDATPDLAISSGYNPEYWFGAEVASAGDFNGDNYPDLMVSAWRYNEVGGQVLIYFGGPTMDVSPDVILAGETPSSYFGYKIAPAGDVNRDGHDDIVVGAYGYAGLTGRAYVFLGGMSPSTSPAMTLTGVGPSDYLGCAVAGAGDVNGDGFDDVIIGAAEWPQGAGRALICYGGSVLDNTPDVVLRDDPPGAEFGHYVHGPGDVNGDGFADVMVGSDYSIPRTGKLSLYLGGRTMDAVRDGVIAGELYSYSYIGWAAAGVGDMNGDGFEDVLVGEMWDGWHGDRPGQAYLYFNGGFDFPRMTVFPVSVDFGEVVIGQPATQEVVVANTGTAPLEVGTTALTGPAAAEFSIAGGTGAPFTVLPGQTYTVQLAFAPTSAPLAQKSATLIVQGNDPAQGEQSVTLVGKGIPALPFPFVILAGELAEVKSPAAVEGDIHSNGSIEIGKGVLSTVTGDLNAMSDITIDRFNTINGDVFAGGNLIIRSPVIITGVAHDHWPVTPFALTVLSFTAGGEDVLLADGQTRQLPPGSYGNVHAGIGATLGLSAGSYFFATLTAGVNATLDCNITDGIIAVNVLGEVAVEPGFTLNVVPLGEAGSRWVTINSLAPAAVKIGPRARVVGSVIAPAASMQLQSNVVIKGALCAREVQLAKDARLLFHNAASSLSKPLPQADMLLEIPSEIVLQGNYPNPFNPSTTIRFGLPQRGNATLSVFNTLGQEVATLVQGEKEAGYHEAVFDASGLASGVYIYRLQAGSFVETRKMLLVK